MNLLTNFEEIDTIELVDNEDVYDLTVEDNHNFFANELLVHNCGEIILSPYDSCRLMLVNLTSFVKNAWTDRAEFDFTHFGEVAQKAQRLMDDMIDLEIEKIDKILAKIESDPESLDAKQPEMNLWNTVRAQAVNGRRTGLGITGIGDAFAMLGITYGSQESIEMTEAIYKSLAVNSYVSSMFMAKERGSFGVHDANREEDHPFLNRIFDAIDETDLLQGVMVERLTSREWNRRWGRRNIANTTTAPAGSVSVLTQTTSGIEPAFMLHYTRRKKINPNDKDARVDFVDELGDKWSEFSVYHHGFKNWLESLEKASSDIKEMIDISPYAGATANEIDWVSKVDLQAAAQKWVCHAISNCVPKDTLITTDKGLLYYDEIVDISEHGDGFQEYRSEIKVKTMSGEFVLPDQTYNNGVKEIVKIKFSNGVELKCTPNEPIACFIDGRQVWVNASDLIAGDIVLK